MPIPASWPEPSDDEILPEVFLSLEDSVWPPATDVTPAGVAQLSSWEVTREIVGNTLPGQLRGTSGLSVGDARVTARQSDGKPMTPWGRGDRRVTGGGKASLYASHDGPSPAEQLDLGSWLVDPMSGSLASPELGIELLESSYAGRVPNLLPPSYAGSCDPAWIVDTLLRQAGFFSTPAPVSDCILSVPMAGSIWPEVGELDSITSPATWDRTTGPLSPVGGVSAGYITRRPLVDLDSVSQFIAMNVAGTVRLGLGYVVSTLRPEVEIRPGGVLAVRNLSTGTWVTGAYAPGLDSAHPMRVEIEVQRIGADGAWASVRARARSSATAPFGSWVTSSVSSAHAAQDRLVVSCDPGSSVSGLQVALASSPGFWVAPTADIDPLLGTVNVPWLPAATDAWAGIQEVCAAFIGAAWVSNDGIATVRNRDYLAGITSTVETVIVEDQLEDLGWTTDPADTADRLEVTYSPADIETQVAYKYGPIAWQASDVLEIKAGQTIQVTADIDYYAALITKWVPYWESESGIGWTGHSWSAFTNREGSGTHAADTSLVISHQVVSAGRVVITIRNTTGSTLYTVDQDGAPCLILRGFNVARQDTQVTITRGVSESVARNPVTVDLGRHVQNAADATAITDYIWARIWVDRWTANQLRIRCNLARDIGDILLLTHPDSDLTTKVLVTGVALTGDASEITQTLTVTILPPTWADFDAAWLPTAKTWTSGFDAAWAGENWPSFNFDPLKVA